MNTWDIALCALLGASTGINIGLAIGSPKADTRFGSFVASVIYFTFALHYAGIL